MSIKLRPFQEDIINQVRDLMKSGIKSILIQAPCGAGKTVLTAYMMKSASEKNMQSWFIVHRRELLNQSTSTLNFVGVDHGIVASGSHLDTDKSNYVCLIGSLRSRKNKLKLPTLIIHDECHHVAAKSWTDLFKEYPNAFHIGLTATPERTDGKGLKDYFSVMVNGPKYSWLIENNYLSKYRYFAPHDVDTSNLHIRMGDYDKSEINKLVNNNVVTGNAVTEYLKHCKDKRAIVFCASVEHSKSVSEEFNKRGVTSLHIDADTHQDIRDMAIKKLKSGEIKVLCNVDLFGEGVSVDAVEAVIMLRPTQSLGLFIQQAGRALRTFDGKKEAIILDHVGNYKRHGLPDMDRPWTLEGKCKGSYKTKTVYICPVCFAANLSFPCICGYDKPESGTKKREIDNVHGVLTEVQKNNNERINNKIEQFSAKTYQDLCELGKKRGYKNYKAWAYFIHKSREAKRGKK